MKEFEMIIHYDRIGDSDMYNCHEVGELIRCKDCKHFHKAEPTKGDISNVTYCLIEDDGLIINSFPSDDDFCSKGERGERREDD